MLSDTRLGWAWIHFLMDVVSHTTHGILSYLPQATLQHSLAASDTGYSACLNQFQLHLCKENFINID